MATNLLGPPAIRFGRSVTDASDSESDDAMDAVDSSPPPPLPPSSGDPLLDFFYRVVPDTPSATVISLLSAAWSHHPLSALKLLCHLRSVHGSGKSDRPNFYAAALWLHRHHPRTLALNVSNIASFGYLKDLLEILHRLVSSGYSPRPASRSRSLATRSSLRRKNRLAGRALDRYASDEDYRFLHDRVSDLFASLLSADLERLKNGLPVTLAAKWCPSLSSAFDNSTLICESIARRMFPRDDFCRMPEEHYAYKARNRLRRDVLNPLRKALDLPESRASAGDWGSIQYGLVSSVAMRIHSASFLKHDGRRFAGEFLAAVKDRESSIAAGALMPHEILAASRSEVTEEGVLVAELQWRRMVDDLALKGALKSCVAVCDVSGGMNGAARDACAALGLLISELSDEPWKGSVFTFGSMASLQRIEGSTVGERAQRLEAMNHGLMPDIRKVFDEMLKLSVKEEKMISRVFVLSGMEFEGEDEYREIRRMYEEKGYGSSMPEIVFWNLRGRGASPMPVRNTSEEGVALVSGFSKNLLKLFLERDGVLSPEAVMEDAVAGDEYNKLAIHD